MQMHFTAQAELHIAAYCNEHTQLMYSKWSERCLQSIRKVKHCMPDLSAIRTYFTRWLIRMNLYDLTCTKSHDFSYLKTSLVKNSYDFSYLKSTLTYFKSCTSRINFYEWPTPNPLNLNINV